MRSATLLLSQRIRIANKRSIPLMMSVGVRATSTLRADEGFRQSLSMNNDWGPVQIHREFSSIAMAATNATFRNSKIIHIDDEPLPRTLQDALRPSSRAIVITETSTSFLVFNVNKAWEGLCGYSYLESKGKKLGSLLKGPETDPLAVTSLLSQLLRGEESTALITNYKKDGSKFRNRLRAGPLYDENGKVTHYIGVLQEV